MNHRTMNRRRILAAAATVTGIAAALVAGLRRRGRYRPDRRGQCGHLGVLIVARGTLRGEKPRPVRHKKLGPRPTLRAADFPAYATIASDVEWARMSRRHYEHALRPRLARLAATLDQKRTVDLTGPSAVDADGPGPDLATLDRIVTHLEGP